MAKVSSRTVVNRKAISAIREGHVEGMEAMGQAWVVSVNPPDATPFGAGLVTTPDYGIWADGKKVAGTGNKPRRVAVKSGVTLIAGEGFPGRFQELGTVHHAPQPHVTPAMLQVLPDAHGYLKPPVKRALARVR